MPHKGQAVGVRYMTPEDAVGWEIALDLSVYCVECAPTEADARRLWGAGPDDRFVVVGPVTRVLAAYEELVCDNCGRRLDRLPG